MPVDCKLAAPKLESNPVTHRLSLGDSPDCGRYRDRHLLLPGHGKSIPHGLPDGLPNLQPSSVFSVAKASRRARLSPSSDAGILCRGIGSLFRTRHSERPHSPLENSDQRFLVFLLGCGADRPTARVAVDLANRRFRFSLWACGVFMIALM